MKRNIDHLSKTRKVAALAGRRPDDHLAKRTRFPLANLKKVRKNLRDIFYSQKITHLVCSAACGSDLIALDLALDYKIECHIMIPFTVEEFRKTSVIDRPGDWGLIYDKVTKMAAEKGTLHLLGLPVHDEQAYFKTTESIIYKAQDLVETGNALAVVVWEGESHEGRDATNDFINLSKKAGFMLLEVPTL